MNYLLAIGSRYGALAVQFLIVVLVTNTLTPSEAGQYFFAFGLVATLFSLAGLGLPDGLVITVGNALSSGKTATIRNALRSSVRRGLASTAGGFGGAAALAILFGYPATYTVMVAVWGLLYGMVFVAAQALVALRKASLGSFFFYSSTNVFLTITSVPYLLAAPSPTLTGLISMTLLAASLSAVAAYWSLWRSVRAYPGTETAELGAATRVGATIAVSRVLQAMIYWIPVWITMAMLDAGQAAVIATAGRLLIAVSAVIAALRFSVRPAIVAAAADEDWPGIERLARQISLSTTLFTLAAMIGLYLIGRPILDVLFGPEYNAVWPILLILLFGALGEAIGGPVDEILKLTGRSGAVFVGLIVTVLVEVAIGFAMAEKGVAAIAASQAAAFILMYGFQIIVLWQHRGILVGPLASSKAS